jgi:hypothetical protein
VIPAQASEPDLREALVIVSDIRDVAEEKGAPIPYRVLLTKMHPFRTRVTEFVYTELARHGLPIFRTVLQGDVPHGGAARCYRQRGGRGRDGGADGGDRGDHKRGSIEELATSGHRGVGEYANSEDEQTGISIGGTRSH